MGQKQKRKQEHFEPLRVGGFFCQGKQQIYYHGVANSWYNLNHSPCSVYSASAKQKGIYSANSTEQSQHRITHSPARTKWAVFRNTQYKGLSRHQQNCNYIWIQLSIFKMPFYGLILQKSDVPLIMTVCAGHAYLLFSIGSYCDHAFTSKRASIILKARPPVPI